MTMRKALFILSFIFIGSCLWAGLVSCKPSNNSDIDASELTLLMRSMEKDMKKVKKQVQKESKKIGLPDWNAIYEVRSSKSEMDTVTFNAFASALLASTENLKNASPEERPAIYKATVDICMTCHTSMCPGPKVRIKKLYLPK